MAASKSRKHSNATLKLDGELSIYRAAELKDLLLARIEQGGPLDLDLSGVTELDSAGVQLLMLAKQAALARGLPLRLLAHSPTVVDVFELLNLGAYFGDPLVMPAHA